MDKKTQFLELLKWNLINQFKLNDKVANRIIRDSKISERMASERAWNVISHYNVEYWAKDIFKKYSVT